jgi:hypothetical protein
MTKPSIDRAEASPTKQFFVSMLTRDISLADAILDLVDNCLAGALRLADGGEIDAKHLVKIEIAEDHFSARRLMSPMHRIASTCRHSRRWSRTNRSDA